MSITQNARKFWHYTTAQAFYKILSDGVIKPATAHVPENEKPIVWFSSNEQWEQTANKSWTVKKSGTVIPLDMKQTAQLGGGLVRIGVECRTAPHDWKTLRELSGMSSAIARGLYDVAISQGARPGDWRGTFEPVSRSKWIAVEVFHEGVWKGIRL